MDLGGIIVETKAKALLTQARKNMKLYDFEQELENSKFLNEFDEISIAIRT